MGDDLERVHRPLGERHDPHRHLYHLAFERPRVHEAELDLPDGSPWKDACKGKRGRRHASQQRQRIRWERDAGGKVPAKNGLVQAALLRQPACHRRVKVAGRGELREPERRTRKDMRGRAVEEEGEFGESGHVVQCAPELLEERGREEPLTACIGECCIAYLTGSCVSCEIRVGGQSFEAARGER